MGLEHVSTSVLQIQVHSAFANGYFQTVLMVLKKSRLYQLFPPWSLGYFQDGYVQHGHFQYALVSFHRPCISRNDRSHGSEERLAPLLASWELGVPRRVLQRGHETRHVVLWFKGKTPGHRKHGFTVSHSFEYNFYIWYVVTSIIRLLKSPIFGWDPHVYVYSSLIVSWHKPSAIPRPWNPQCATLGGVSGRGAQWRPPSDRCGKRRLCLHGAYWGCLGGLKIWESPNGRVRDVTGINRRMLPGLNVLI